MCIIFGNSSKLPNLTLQIKVNLSSRRDSDTAAIEAAEEEKGAGLSLTSDPVDMQAVDELKRAFELVEVTSPGLSDLILQKIVLHLQQWYNKTHFREMFLCIVWHTKTNFFHREVFLRLFSLFSLEGNLSIKTIPYKTH